MFRSGLYVLGETERAVHPTEASQVQVLKDPVAIAAAGQSSVRRGGQKLRAQNWQYVKYDCHSPNRKSDEA
jgi:hypothetical protein